MRFAAAHIGFLRGRAGRVGNLALGAWLRLYAHVAEHEQVVESEVTEAAPLGEGRIAGCAEWTNRDWLMMCGTDFAGVKAAIAAGLARFEGADLLVDGVDVWGTHRVRQTRLNGAKGGRPTRNPPVNPRVMPPVAPVDNPLANPTGTPLLSSPSLAFPPLGTGEDSAEPAKPASPPPPPVLALAPSPEPSDPVVMVFPTVRGAKPSGVTEWPFRESDLRMLKKGYPNLDVLGEAGKALVWAQTNPANRKTADGMPAFLGRWMNKAQNIGGSPELRGGRRAAGRADATPTGGYGRPGKQEL